MITKGNYLKRLTNKTLINEKFELKLGNYEAHYYSRSK